MTVAANYDFDLIFPVTKVVCFFMQILYADFLNEVHMFRNARLKIIIFVYSCTHL